MSAGVHSRHPTHEHVQWNHYIDRGLPCNRLIVSGGIPPRRVTFGSTTRIEDLADAAIRCTRHSKICRLSISCSRMLHQISVSCRRTRHGVGDRMKRSNGGYRIMSSPWARPRAGACRDPPCDGFEVGQYGRYTFEMIVACPREPSRPSIAGNRIHGRNHGLCTGSLGHRPVPSWSILLRQSTTPQRHHAVRLIECHQGHSRRRNGDLRAVAFAGVEKIGMQDNYCVPDGTL